MKLNVALIVIVSCLCWFSTPGTGQVGRLLLDKPEGNSVGGGKFKHDSDKPLKISQQFPISSSSSSSSGVEKRRRLAVIFDSSGIERELELELLAAVGHAFKALEEDHLHVDYMDIGKMSNSPSITSALLQSAQWILRNETRTVISLLEPEVLSEFTLVYHGLRPEFNLTVFTPRLARRNVLARDSVQIRCLQMSEMAAAIALLNRVERTGVKVLVPVLDRDNSAQLELLGYFVAAGQERMDMIHFTTPIFLRHGERSHGLEEVLNDPANGNSSRGILILATRGSQTVVEAANGSENMFQMRWFSPNLIHYEEWLRMGAGKGDLRAKGTFGIYSAQYVGARGWDNPTRRKILRELTVNTGASPRVLSSILAYDTAWMATKHVGGEPMGRMQGLTGDITFDAEGYRREGLYFGASAVPELTNPFVALLQPSAWILEDVLNIIETIEGQYLITEYTVATSSVLTREELLRFAGRKGNSSNCRDHGMEIVAHDPFNQIVSSYSFTSENLPEHLLIPNQHGYGITFSCLKGHDRQVTLKIACTAGVRLSDPVKCFRSGPVVRRRRAAGVDPYGYGMYHGNSYWGKLPAGSSNSHYYGGTFARRELPPQDPGSSQYYYGSPDYSAYNPATYSSLTTKLDIPIVSEDVTSTTAAPLPLGPKLPELRQILKASKPFVGSCVGSATGCATCVLILGRLPLGTLPPACTGPCMVGVFGSCGALLGRAFSETTVICTELFRQGFIDTETFLADAEFGLMMKEQNPTVLQGYRILATPLVQLMRESRFVTRVVATFAVPWAKHMKYTMGYSEDLNFLGAFIHFIGGPICFISGTIHKWLLSSSSSSPPARAPTLAAPHNLFNLLTTALIVTICVLFISIRLRKSKTGFIFV